MQIVIDIPIDTHYHTKKRNVSESDIKIILEAISKGVSLPKGHGRLKDTDELLRKHPDFDAYPFPSTTIDNAPTIIEADKEESEDKE